MYLTDPQVIIKIGANTRPDKPNLTGSNRVGRDVIHRHLSAGLCWGARIIFGATGQTATLNLTTKTITRSASGVRQVESAVVNAAIGCTAAGTMDVTMTTGGVLAVIPVALTPAAHGSASLVAAAIAAALNSSGFLDLQFSARSDGETVILSKLYPAANDATLNLAFGGDLGIAVLAASSNTTTGVAGVAIEQVGGVGNDIYGEPLLGVTADRRVFGYHAVASPTDFPGIVTSNLYGALAARMERAWSTEAGITVGAEVLTAGDKATYDFIIISN